MYVTGSTQKQQDSAWGQCPLQIGRASRDICHRSPCTCLRLHLCGPLEGRAAFAISAKRCNVAAGRQQSPQVQKPAAAAPTLPSDLQGPQGCPVRPSTAGNHAYEDDSKDSQSDKSAPAAAPDNQVTKIYCSRVLLQYVAMDPVCENWALQALDGKRSDKDLPSLTVKTIFPSSKGFHQLLGSHLKGWQLWGFCTCCHHMRACLKCRSLHDLLLSACLKQ